MLEKHKCHKNMYVFIIMPAASLECHPHFEIHVACNHYEKCPMQRAAGVFFASHYISGEAQPQRQCSSWRKERGGKCTISK